MHCVNWDGQNLVLEINRREKRLLFDLLKLYPLIPASHHPVSRASAPGEIGADRKLLEEALAEQRSENRKQVAALLQTEDRFQEIKAGFRFSLTAPEAEWLLQVLNDVRVGSWLVLGEPDEKKGKTLELTEPNDRYVWAMELAGYFEMTLLDALHGPDASRSPSIPGT